MNPKVTFSDIAAYTNFSKTTISRYFNYPESVSPENRQIISQALEKLHYQENKIARSLAKGKSEFIGIIIPHFDHQFYSEIVGHLIDSYDQSGYKFLIFLGKDNPDQERRYIQELMANKVEGLIELSHNLDSEELKNIGLPTVSIEREDRFISSVNTDNYYGGKLAADKLLADGCEALIHVNESARSTSPGYLRLTGFCDTCQNRGYKADVYRKNPTGAYMENCRAIDEIYQDIRRRYPDRKKGIFLSSDTYADIFINLLLKNNESIPEEYEIIGFDNSSRSYQGIFPFSTVTQNTQAIAEQAVRLLQQQIQAFSRTDGYASRKCITIEPSLTLRGSTLP